MCFGIPMFYVYMLWTFYVRFTYPYHGHVTEEPKSEVKKNRSYLNNRVRLHLYLYLYVSCFAFVYVWYTTSFSHQPKLVVFHWILRDSKSPHIFMILLRILANLVNDVVWMVSPHPLIFNSSRPFIKSLGIILSVLIIVTWNLIIIELELLLKLFNCLKKKSYFLITKSNMTDMLFTGASA